MKLNWDKTKKNILFVSLLFITLYIPISFAIYSSSWYEFNYELYRTYELIGKENATNATENLISYFTYKNELNGDIWNAKEKAHMNEVRTIFDTLFIIFILSLASFLLLTNKNKNTIKKISKTNIKIILSLLIILPFFTTFWVAFHEILFTNNLWIITPDDISYYLFPQEFFRNTLLLVILTGTSTNLIINYTAKII